MTEKQLSTERQSIGVSKNRVPVWYDKVASHAATHISDTPVLAILAAEITSKIDLTDNYAQFHSDMGRIVGNSDLVDIEPENRIVYAKRLNRDNYSIFNLSKSPQPSSLVTTVYTKQDDGTYELVSTWIGSSDSPSFSGTSARHQTVRNFGPRTHQHGARKKFSLQLKQLSALGKY